MRGDTVDLDLRVFIWVYRVGPEAVIPQELALALQGDVGKLHDGLHGRGVLPAFGVAKVGAGKEDVVSDGCYHILDARIVRLSRDETLVLKVLDGGAVEAEDLEPPGATLYPRLQAFRPEGGPAAAGLQENHLQLGYLITG